MNIIERIKENSRLYPDVCAIISGEEELTYRDLDIKSGRLAAYIERTKNSDKTPIAVYGHKSPNMLIAFLACVRSGRAYAPIDISMPHERIIDIVEKTGNNLVITTEDGSGISEEYNIIDRQMIDRITGEENPEIEGDKAVSGDDIFYIIFTSGSTGRPKGVQISCDALTHFTDWMREFSGSCHKTNPIFMNQAPFSFDLSVMDLYTSLSQGGTVFTLDKKLQKNMALMFEKMGESGIECWVSTPSFADMCLADRKFSKDLMKNLDTFLFCGEKLTNRTAAKLMERFPEAKIYNTYGPTESTVAVTGVEITTEMVSAEKDLPIGIPKPGTEIEIDPENSEIIIKGDTVSKGYFRDPEKTAAVFDEKDGVRCYRTGDAGSFEDGMLMYRGRIDLQVKLHGYRIELGDIDSNLMSIDGISAACTIPKKDDEGKIRSLISFIVKPGAEGGFKEAKAVKTELKKHLPDYMIPKKIIFRDSLPMTSNGKTDRRKLEETL